MGETGVFSPDARLELIEGEIFEMATIHPPHAGAVITLNRILVERAGDRAAVSVQNPVIASELSVPQPDFTLLKPRRDNYSTAHPRREDIILVIEVADTTLAADLRIKAPLYARAGIAEAWVVDVNERIVHVFRGPGPGAYREVHIARGEDRLMPVELPMLSLRVAEIFPGREP
jgi:Uma2 family endonuclease